MLNTTKDKRGTILAAAFDVFMNYGFRKTSMDDIARAAGMSRPALYQVFRNKTEIFRALSHALMRRTADEARHALQADLPFGERLFNALDVSILELHRKIDSTPHGAELLGVNDEVAGDIEEDWCETMTKVLGEAVTEAVRSGEISLDGLGLDAPAVAGIMVQAMEGLKTRYMRGNAIENDVRNIVAFVANALARKAA